MKARLLATGEPLLHALMLVDVHPSGRCPTVGFGSHCCSDQGCSDLKTWWYIHQIVHWGTRLWIFEVMVVGYQRASKSLKPPRYEVPSSHLTRQESGTVCGNRMGVEELQEGPLQ